jgi:hypothetical protein
MMMPDPEISPRDNKSGVAVLAVALQRVRSTKNLHDAGAHPFRERLHGFAYLLKRINAAVHNCLFSRAGG